MAYTIYDFNREAKKHGLRLYSGTGYYYWVCLDEKLSTPDSVYIYRFNQGDKKFWDSCLNDAIKQSKQEV